MTVLNIYGVNEITKHIKTIMEQDFTLQNLMVRGEISNFKQHYSGHCYFTLKDSSSSLKSVMFRGKAQYLKFMPTNGMKVVANGSISVYERDGAYQMYVDMLIPEGAGELSVAFEQLKTKLTQEGLFEKIHKKSLPILPKTVGIITSATGAVLRDIYKVSKRRNPNVQLVLYPVQVQGLESASQLVQAVKFFNKKFPVDVLIIGRGGGSMEDLWSFNEEKVVRAIFASKIPVVSAVGHETDYTLSDFVSDVRAATPSQAAELIVPDARELTRYIQSLFIQADLQIRHTLQTKKTRLMVCLKSKTMQKPQLLLQEKRQHLDDSFEKVEQLRTRLFVEKKHKMNVVLEKLHILNPVAVLKRGYGIVKIEKKIVYNIDAVKPGQKLAVILSDGSFDAIVADVRKGQVLYGEK
ncbi:exodeoxyribonuclease VII large subunit [Propionispira arboris]|uniref:exodeoxyribonuclease VII large subunit n=1 Tax=Propionispira arboris TaxID=84035 RepID=UPI0015A62B57|nr:exodeoxyribonuclease VII large subunit [Propionispira arboris]